MTFSIMSSSATGSSQFPTTLWWYSPESGEVGHSDPPAMPWLDCVKPIGISSMRIFEDVGLSMTPRATSQAFFCRIVEKDYLGDVDRGKSRFRAFLLAS